MGRRIVDAANEVSRCPGENVRAAFGVGTFASRADDEIGNPVRINVGRPVQCNPEKPALKRRRPGERVEMSPCRPRECMDPAGVRGLRRRAHIAHQYIVDSIRVDVPDPAGREKADSGRWRERLDQRSVRPVEHVGSPVTGHQKLWNAVAVEIAESGHFISEASIRYRVGARQAEQDDWRLRAGGRSQRKTDQQSDHVGSGGSRMEDTPPASIAHTDAPARRRRRSVASRPFPPPRFP